MWFAVSLLITVVTLIWYAMKPFYWSNHNIPYLIPLPIIGNCFNLLKYGTIDYFKYLHSQCPGQPYFGLHFFTKPALYIKDPEILQRIFVTDYEHFTSHGMYTNQDRDPLGGRNLFSINGEQWKEVRGKLTPFFTPAKIRAMLECAFNTLPKLNDNINSEIDKGNPIELTCLSRLTTIDVITQAIFGITTDTFTNKDSIFYKLTESVFIWQFSVRIFTGAISSKLYDFLKFTVYDKKFTEIVKDMVCQTIKIRKKENIIRQDFLQGMIELLETKSVNDGKYFDDNTPVPKYDMGTVLSQALIFQAAGVDSTSTTTAMVLYELAINTEMQDKCRAEIKAAVHNNPVAIVDLSKLIYLSAVIDETLRKYPPLCVINRKCTKKYTFPDGKLTIEPGTFVVTSPSSIQLDEKHFPQPDVFRPERFLGQERNQIKPATYFPFGIGPRTCIGMNFALKEIKLVTSRLLQQFEFSICTQTEIPIKFSKHTFLNRPENGMWLQLKPVNCKYKTN